LTNDKLPVLVFVHGAWHGAWCWEQYFLPYFTESGFECYAFDFPNHGVSKNQKGINKHRIVDYVDCLKLVLKQIDKPVVLIGHSMGGYVVQKYLETNDCAGAILMASVPTKPIWRIFLKIAVDIPYSLLGGFLVGNLEKVVDTPKKARKLLFSVELPEEHVERYVALLSKESRQVIFFDFLFSKLKKRKNQTFPVLVQAYRNDEMISIEENKETAELQNADYQEIKSGVHDMMLELNWELSAKNILNWLEEKFPVSAAEEAGKEENDQNLKLNIEFPDAVSNLLSKLGDNNSIDADLSKIKSKKKSNRNN